jgi:hypothetical protein
LCWSQANMAFSLTGLYLSGPLRPALKFMTLLSVKT